MKRYLIENAGFVHMMLFFIWFPIVIATFCCGTEMFKEASYIPLTALIAILFQLAFAIVETDWIKDISNESGY